MEGLASIHTRSSSATGSITASHVRFLQQPQEQRLPTESSVETPAIYASSLHRNTLSDNDHRLMSTCIPSNVPELVHHERVESAYQMSAPKLPLAMPTQQQYQELPAEFQSLSQTKSPIAITDGMAQTDQRLIHLKNLDRGSGQGLQTFDGTSELARVRAGLRPIVEKVPTKPRNTEQGEDMLDELDSLLLSAIKERPYSEDGSSSQDNHSEIASLVEPENINLEKTPRSPLQHQGETRTSLDKHQQYEYAGPFTMFSSPASVDSSDEAPIRESPVVDRRHIPPKIGSRISSSQGIKSGHDAGFGDRKPHADAAKAINKERFPIRPRFVSSASATPGYKAQRPSAFTRYRSNPIRQRAAVFETSIKEPLPLDLDCKAPHSGDVRYKESWVSQPSFKKPPRPARRIVHPKSISPTTGDPCLIPLQLPRLVSNSATPIDLGLNDDVSENSDFATAQESRSSRSGLLKGHMYELEGQDPFFTVEPNISKASFTGMEANKDREPSISHPQPARVLETCHHPPQAQSRPGSPHGPSTTQAATTHVSIDTVQGEISPGSGGKRPSIVKSKIQQLMAASNKSKGTDQILYRPSRMIGRANSSKTDTRIEQGDAVGPKKMPALQMPLSEQAKMFSEDGKLSSPPTERYLNLYRSSVATPASPQRTITPLRSIPGSPLRGRSRAIRQSVSSRGSPYSVEQSYTLSPVPNMSINDRSSVKVSIELRRSPERGSNDDHLLIVRASVEPEEKRD